MLLRLDRRTRSEQTYIQVSNHAKISHTNLNFADATLLRLVNLMWKNENMSAMNKAVCTQHGSLQQLAVKKKYEAKERIIEM